jgi:hypothetical protein
MTLLQAWPTGQLVQDVWLPSEKVPEGQAAGSAEGELHAKPAGHA